MKNTAIFLMVVLIVTCATANLKAAWEDIVFTEDGVIQDGDRYIQLTAREIPPDTTTIEMTGGNVGSLFIYDNSTVNITGGCVSGEFYVFDPENNDDDNIFRCPPEYSVCVSDHSTVNLAGGSVDSIQCKDWGTVNITAGTVSIQFSDHATIYICGGVVNFRMTKPYIWDSNTNASHLYISGGQILGTVWLNGNSTMDIYGYNFDYNPDGGDMNGGQLTGFWQDGSPFSIDFGNWQENISYDHVVLHEISRPDIAAIRIQQAIDEKEKASAKIDAALEKERSAIESLNESLASGEFGDLSRREVLLAKMRIYLTIYREMRGKAQLQRSIKDLERSLEFLNVEPGPNS